MPTLNGRITDLVEGDSVSIRRTIDRTPSGLQTGVLITDAWLTVKAALADADPGLFQKQITTTNVAGTGHIENDGTGDVNPIIRFDLLPADTLLIGQALRFYDIQVKTNGGAIYTPELGIIDTRREVTTSSS